MKTTEPKNKIKELKSQKNTINQFDSALIYLGFKYRYEEEEKENKVEDK